MWKRALISRLIALTIVGTTLISNARADSNDERLERLHELYQCPIFSYLVAIHRQPHKIEQNRFLIIEMSYPGDGRYYAQCAFEQLDARIYCEAASAYFDPRLKEYFTADRLKVLVTLGYTTVFSSNNYNFRRQTPDLKSLYELAGTLVETLGRVFDLQIDERLIYHAPLVKKLPKGSPPGGFCDALVSMR